MKTLKKMIPICLLALALVISITLLTPKAEAAAESDLTFKLNSVGNGYIVSDCKESASGELVIPATYKGKPVTTIGDYAFYYCQHLTGITIPGSVTTIGESAFESCDSLTSITIPDSVTTIGESAFVGCSSLTSVTIPDSVTTIGDYAFSVCSSLTSVTIPDSVTTIGDHAFYYCENLTSITIPDGVTTIGDYAFYYCYSLTSVTIPDSVTTIGEGAFYYCSSLTSVTIPDSVTTIGKSVFESCDSLTGITIPDSITTIGWSAFDGCDSLKSVTIPDSVTTIDSWAFSGCNSLQTVYYAGTKNQWNNISIDYFNNALTNATIHYNHIHSGKLETYHSLNAGKHQYICTVCGGTIIEKHTWDKGKVTYPTLTQNGYTALTCTGCGYERVENYTFPDVHSREWYYKAVEFSVAKGFFSGHGDGTFGPSDGITRQDFVVVLARLAKANLSKYSGVTNFKDVSPKSYYAKAVHWASANRVVMGYNDTEFGVDDKITREQLVTILYRYAMNKGYNISVSSNAMPKLNAFRDSGKISAYAKVACAWALEKGVLSGKNPTTFDPTGAATRAQVATILMNISLKKIMPI